MRAVGLDSWGGPEVLRTVELPDPRPAAGELLVRVTAAGVAPVDVMARTGLLARLYQGSEPPFVPGMEIAGTVAEVGLAHLIPAADAVGANQLIDSGKARGRIALDTTRF